MERFNSFTSDQIVLTKRQASMTMASILLFCLFVFIVGFFLGKRSSIDEFSQKVSNDSLHDQIDFLLTTQSLQTSATEEELGSFDNVPQEFSARSFDEPFERAIITQLQETPVSAIVTPQPELNDVLVSKDAQDSPVAQPQYAQLIGFGTKKAAQMFVARLKKYNVPVILKTVISKTAAGKERVWYQAITPTYQSAQELQGQIAKVKRLEHIRDKDIKIVYVH